MSPISQKERQAVFDIAAKYGARNLRVFGSTARGEESARSDIDLLVELEQGRSLLDQVGLQQELEQFLKRPVDVVIEGGLSPYLEERILAEAVPL
jgi:predicted nucleotidyltransferase